MFLVRAEVVPGMPGRTTVATRSRLSIDDLGVVLRPVLR